MAIERIGEHALESLSRVDTIKQAVPAMANQFEAVFLQSVLKSTCIDQHFTGDVSPFSPYESTGPLGLNSGVDKPDASIEPIEIGAIAAEKEPLEISQTVDGFIKSIWPYAKQASNLMGLDPKILMAQAALETGWGQFIAKDRDGSSSYNLFNIKASNTDLSVKIKTTEYITDTPIKMMASFKKYPSIEHSFNDYVSLIKDNSRYREALANTSDPKRYIDALHDAGYATDPDYANKIMSIYNGDELQRALERNGYQ